MALVLGLEVTGSRNLTCKTHWISYLCPWCGNMLITPTHVTVSALEMDTEHMPPHFISIQESKEELRLVYLICPAPEQALEPGSEMELPPIIFQDEERDGCLPKLARCHLKVEDEPGG